MSIEAVLRNEQSWHIETADVLDGLRSLPEASVHCVVTSPPYWGLRDYGVDGQIGLEKSPQEYLARMVAVFGEVRRVLRDDGTVWLNIGDSYAGSNCGGGTGKSGLQGSAAWHENSKIAKQTFRRDKAAVNGIGHKGDGRLKAKDLCGIPWRLAFALQDAGWWLRAEIIWAKRSPMPESVTDRPTKAHEQIFLMTKSARYFYDSFASAESATGHKGTTAGPCSIGAVSQRNMRTVWALSTEPFSGAHFATFPTELVRRCLLAGTSERGCCQLCGAPWKRIVDRQRLRTRPGENSNDPGRHVTELVTAGWRQSCECATPPPIRCVGLAPFSGAGTTVMTARRMQLRGIGFELNQEYAEMSRGRIIDDAPLLNGT